MILHVARLDDVCEINPRMPKALADEDIASFLPMAGVSEDGQIDFEEERPVREVRKGYTYFERGDVLIARITPCFENGKATRTSSLARPIGFGSTEFHVLRAGAALDTSYLFHMLWNPRFREIGANNMTGSAGQKRVPTDFLKRLEIPLPPLDEQQRIVAILDKANALRRKRERALELLQVLIGSLVGEYLSTQKTIELGGLIADGPTNGLYKPSSAYGDGFPILRINNFYDGRIVDISSLRRLDVSDIELSRFQLNEGDIVINRVNSLPYLGKSALVQGLLEPTVYESNMMRFSLRRSVMLPEVCIALLQTPAIKAQILSKAKNAVNQSSINQKDVCDLILPLPKMANQKSFVAAVHKIFRIEAAAIRDNTSIFALSSFLQHQAFSGQLR